MTEDNLRDELICRGCGKPKPKGLVVCWDCFKGGDHPLKTSGLDIEVWLERYGVNPA